MDLDSQKGGVLKTSLTRTPPLFIEVSVPNQESEESCMSALGVSFGEILTSS